MTATAPAGRRWIRVVLALVGVAALSVLLAPSIAALPMVRNRIVRSASGAMNGSVEMSALRVGWFRPLEIENLEILPPAGPPLVSVESCQADRTLWQWLTGGGELGRVRIERPLVRIVLDQGRSNFEEVFGPAAPNDDERKDRAPPNVSLALEIVGGRLAFRDAPDDDEWTLGALNVVAALERSQVAGESPKLTIEPGRLVDHVPLTPEVCNDVLKFVAPVLAGASRCQGSFSMALDQAALPLGDPAAGTLAGTLEVHAVDVGAGQFVQALAAALGAPDTVRIAEESHIRFVLADRRVAHEGLEFGLGSLRISSSGSVGLDDDSLDLVAVVQLPDINGADSALREAFSGRTIAIPIQGTLDNPQIAAGTLLGAGADVALELLPALLRGDNAALESLGRQLGQADWGKLLDRLRDDDDRLLPEGLLQNRRLLDRLLGREPQEPPPLTTGDGPAEGDAEKQPEDDDTQTQRSDRGRFFKRHDNVEETEERSP